MSTTTQSTVEARVQDLHDHIAQGKVLEAFNEFYAPDVVMQENSDEPTNGFEANLAREKEFLGAVKEWLGFEVNSMAVQGDTAFVETTSDYVLQDGTKVHTEQIAKQVWKDGKIVSERFFYNA